MRVHLDFLFFLIQLVNMAGMYNLMILSLCQTRLVQTVIKRGLFTLTICFLIGDGCIENVM